MTSSTKNSRRLEFIEFQLTWRGRVGRTDLQRQFKISPQQATNDLGQYGELAPANIDYNPKLRTYVRGNGFKPLLTRASPSEYLTQLEMCAAGFRSQDAIWPEPVPTFETIQASTRQVERETLALVLAAIEGKYRLMTRYVSLSTDDEEIRDIVPHALANDGHRWHVRAYDLNKQRHSDFVLSRLRAVSVDDSAAVEFPADAAWTTIVAVKLRPEDGLSPRQRQGLEIEYEMIDGCLERPVRRAMLYYYLRHFGFDPRLVDGSTMRNTSSFHLEITNIAEVEHFLDRRA